MLVSFDIQFIRRDEKQRRNGEACQAVMENTMLVSSDTKFIRRDQKQRRDGEACQAVIENTMLASSNIKFSDDTRNSVDMARLAEPIRRVSGRA